LSQDYLDIRGANVHNLKNISLRLPHEKLIVVTGVSGSGKSSLVFDTIYAEGQRRYLESLSVYARQFLERMEKPDVEHIGGVSPAVAIRQTNTARNPRSTVATATEIYDFLRLLYARAGETTCRQCGQVVSRDPVDRVATRIMALPTGSRWYVLFPLQIASASNLDAELKIRLEDLRRKGFNRLFQESKIAEFSNPESLLGIDFDHPVYALVDRLAISPGLDSRVVDAIEICYREAGEVVFQSASTASDEQFCFSERFECRDCCIEYLEPEPRLFSFNSPFGACSECQGFGNTVDYDLDLVVPDKFKTLQQGAVEPFTKPRYKRFQRALMTGAKGSEVRTSTPFHELTDGEIAFVLRGANGFNGVEGFFRYLERKKYKMHIRIFLARYRGYTLCSQCRGGRLRSETLNVRINGKVISEVTALTLESAKLFFDRWKPSDEQKMVSEQLREDVLHRLTFLNDVGLGYLTLNRLTATLSGGEVQRIQLATSLGSRLVGTCYVLDEPSIGLHARDTNRLIKSLQDLRDLGNTIVVVEHDSAVIRSADHIVDLGPGAGEHGGEVVFQGTNREMSKTKCHSLTAQYLQGVVAIPMPAKRLKPKSRKKLKFYGAAVNNLKNLNFEIPVGLMTAVTGVSGSGKSTLVHNVVHDGLAAIKKQKSDQSFNQKSLRLPCRRITGSHFVEEVILVDQSQIGRSPRSNPVTYVKAFDAIRAVFAATADAQQQGFSAGNFSFNIPGGRCETCQGDGRVTVEMQFLADVSLICEDCNGERYKSDILAIKYRGNNIHAVLRMTIDEALNFFSHVPSIVKRLSPLAEVGLGYLRLGQSATTLSGGEAQRVKLASHVAQSKCERTLYLFDEPTTGLHFDDIKKLLAAFRKLIDCGGSVLVIEHNLDVIKNADWVIDLGPEGGSAGGDIVAEGTPETIAHYRNSHTGNYLQKFFSKTNKIATL
tara:strand:- start:11051 stop:13882 length:2832 start_codon:yes stop_codon:yes gene_type:complete